MSAFIPLCHNRADCELAEDLHPNAEVLRVPLDGGERCLKGVTGKRAIWVDPCVDGLVYPDVAQRPSYRKFYKGHKGYQEITNCATKKVGNKAEVREFVRSVLFACKKLDPKYITIPQLPLVSTGARNKINSLMCEYSAEWRASAKYKGRFVLPVVFTDRAQYGRKPLRTKKLELVTKLQGMSSAEAVWSVDSTLQDQLGTATNPKRFAALIEFHSLLQSSVSTGVELFSGPYWGVNLLLYAKGLVTHSVIGLGRGYQYQPHGRLITQEGNVRLPIPALRRWANADPQLKGWFYAAAKVIPKGELAHYEFSEMAKKFDVLSEKAAARRLVGKFYREWVESIEVLPAAGRAIALYQDLSAAYVIGKMLPNLPGENGVARKPEIVAQQLMLNCL